MAAFVVGFLFSTPIIYILKYIFTEVGYLSGTNYSEWGKIEDINK